MSKPAYNFYIITRERLINNRIITTPEPHLADETVFLINCRIAKEILAERLAIEVSEENIQKLVTCMTELEID